MRTACASSRPATTEPALKGSIFEMMSFAIDIVAGSNVSYSVFITARMFSVSMFDAASAAGCGRILMIIAARLACGIDSNKSAAAFGSGMALASAPAVAGVIAPTADALTSGSSAVSTCAAASGSSSNMTNRTSASGPRTLAPERGTSMLGGQTPRRANDSSATAAIAGLVPAATAATSEDAAF